MLKRKLKRQRKFSKTKIFLNSIMRGDADFKAGRVKKVDRG